MVETHKLEIEERQAGKSGNRIARKGGFVPAIIYGGEAKPLSIRINKKLLEKELNKGHFTVRQFELTLGGKNHHVLPRAVQHHPVSGEPLHVDFMRVTEQTRVTVEVQVEFLNEEASPGLKRGGVLSIIRHTIEVSCAVANMPEKFTVDLDGLDIGDSVHVSNIDMPAGVHPIIDDRDFTIAAIAAPTVMVEPAAGEAAEGEEGAEEGDEDGAKKDEEGAGKKKGSEPAADKEK